MTTRLIEPARVGGTNDYSPAQMAARRALLAAIMDVYARFGFEELETPAMEFSEVLLGEEGDNRIWRTQPFSVQRAWEELGTKMDAGPAAAPEALAGFRKTIISDQEVALRFDHTVPLARYVAGNLGQLKLPWRRWCFGPVWRGDATGAGRYSQFYQLDADIVGDGTLVADAEIIWMMTEVLAAVTSRPTKVRWNSRKLLNALAQSLGITGMVLNPETDKQEPRANALFRALDKLEKAGWDGDGGVRSILERKPDNEHDTLALALRPDQIAVVERFLDATTQSTGPVDAFTRLEAVIGSVPVGAEGLSDMRTVAQMLAGLGVSNAEVDFSVARGLDYYTGIVFESAIEGSSAGSPYSGGRFDELVARFTGKSLPSTGASVGFDRLFYVLETLGDLPEGRTSPVDIVIMDFGVTRDPDGDPAVRAKVLQTLAVLRRAGYSARIYDGVSARKMKAVISDATHRGIDFMVVAGERELADGNVNVKNLNTRVQTTVPIADLGSAVCLKSLLDSD